MLALFSGSPYIPPSASSEGGEIDLRPHLTNTCLQTDAYGAPTPPEELVKLFWELEGLTAVQSTITGGFEDAGRVDREWLDMTFAKVGEVVGESVKAGAECGSFGLQLVPNAFEVRVISPGENPQLTDPKPDFRCGPPPFILRNIPCPTTAAHPDRDAARVQCVARLSPVRRPSPTAAAQDVQGSHPN